MPTLSQKTLDKMFECPYCEKLFRTRNGLSGHIQFKHAKNAYCSERKEADYYPDPDITEYGYRLVEGISERWIQSKIIPLREWKQAKETLEFKNIKSEKDYFMAYQLMVHALLASEGRMKRWLNDELSLAISTLMKMQSDTLINMQKMMKQ